MKVLLDEGVPQPLARNLPEHDVQTVIGMGWAGIKNGQLLKLIEGEAFSAFITGDKNMASQQALAGRPFAVLILSAINWPVIRKHIPEIAEAVDRSIPGTISAVDCGFFVPRLRSGPPKPSF